MKHVHKVRNIWEQKTLVLLKLCMTSSRELTFWDILYIRDLKHGI